MSVGKLFTKRGNSVASVGGKFLGTRDGVKMNASGNFQGPVQLSDIGGGNQGVVGEGSFKANIGGIPSKSSHVMVPLTVTPSQAGNLKNAWGFTLKVGKKTPAAGNGKITYVASGQLKLPGGDTVKFTDKVVKYTKHQGYTVTFKKGQNITLATPATDKKSTIAIKKFTLARQSNGTFSPTGGRITYQFMGQKGSGDILSFLPTP